MANPKLNSGTRKPNPFVTLISNWPLKKYIGIYAYLPIFFCMGAALEFAMINMNINNVNFYKVYSKKSSERIAQQQIELQLNIESLIEAEKQKLIDKIKDKERSNQNNPKV